MMSSLDEDGFDDEEEGKKMKKKKKKKKKKRLERLIRRRLIERLFLRVKPHPQNNTTQTKKKSFKNDVDENLLQHNFGFPLDGRAKKSAKKKKKKKKKKKQKKRRPLRIKRVTTCHHDTAVGHAVVFECTKV